VKLKLPHIRLALIIVIFIASGNAELSGQISTTLYAGPNNNGRDTIEICMSITNRDTIDRVLEAGLQQIIVVQFGDAPINGDRTADASCLVSTDFIVTPGTVDTTIRASSVSTANSDDVDFEVAFAFINDLVLSPGETLELFCGQNSRIRGSCEDLVFLLDCSGTQFTIFNNGSIRPQGIEDCTEGFAQQCNPNRPNAMTLRVETSDADCADMPGGSARVIVEGGEPNFTYEWSNGANQSSINDLAVGSYDVTVTDDIGCFEIATFDIGSAPEMVVTFDVMADCPGLSNGSITANVTNGIPSYNYQWSSNTGNQTTQTAINLPGGEYILTITDNSGCVVISQVSLPSIETNPIEVTCLEVTNSSVLVGWINDPFIDQYEVMVDSGIWEVPTDALSHFVTGLSEEQVINVRVRGIGECVPLSAAGVSCVAFEINENNSIYVANIFSPNNDNVNDIIIADGRPGVVINEFSIFDRWGNRAHAVENFAAGDISFGWDGMIGATPASTGVFVYLLKATLPGGVSIKN